LREHPTNLSAPELPICAPISSARSGSRASCEPNTCSHSVKAVADLPIPELVENRRRSIAMLPAGAPALNRDEALEVLRQLGDALRELRLNAG
jgi:hypothetical protein